MLNQLRRRFIIITMSLIGLVLMSITGIICFDAYKTQMNRLDHALEIRLNAPFNKQIDGIRNYNDIFRSNNNEGENDSPISERLGTLTAIVDDSGNISYYDDTYIDLSYEQISDAVKMVTDSNSSSGKLREYKLYYKTRPQVSGMIIAFADYSEVYEDISQTVVFMLLLFAGSMLVFLLISLWLSSYAMRPVAKAWAQQQQFVADASHELKTPLTAILANNNILLANPDMTVRQQQKWIENSQDEAHHMKDLINNMLFLAKSDNEKVNIIFSDVNLSDLVTNTVLQFEPVAFEKGIMIESNIEDKVTMKGDLTQMRQLTYILVDNACKYAGDSGEVNVSLKRISGTIILEVRNTGAPIPKEDLPHIFERFYRSDKVRTQQNQEGGYGLGLAIAKSIVERHKGSVNAASSKASGTIFTVTFRQK